MNSTITDRNRQHPLEYVKPSDRFIIMLEIGQQTKGNGPAYEPLAYGMDGQPSPRQLLRRGSRATSFPTEDAAREALAESAEGWKRDGCTFHHGKQILFCKVEIA